MIVDDRLPHGGPGARAGEDVHSRPAREHLPARALEQAEKRRLVQMPERVALVRVDGEVDLRGVRHGGWKITLPAFDGECLL